MTTRAVGLEVTKDESDDSSAGVLRERFLVIDFHASGEHIPCVMVAPADEHTGRGILATWSK